MYQKLQQNLVINDLWCNPYEVLSENPVAKERCLLVFPNVPDKANIIYSSSAEGIIVLGYYVLDNANLTLSRYYETLRSATLKYRGIDETERIKQIDCIHIKSWVFDDVLRNKTYLYRILNSIICTLPSKETHILWYENRQGQLIFYPFCKGVVGGTIRALTHFTNDFLNQ